MEAIVICVDDTTTKKYFRAQIEAVKAYTTYKIESHSQTVIGLLALGDSETKFAVYPTRDVNLDILNSLKCSPKELDIVAGLRDSYHLLTSPRIPKEANKRILMFVGGAVNIPVKFAPVYAQPLIEKCVALDVVHFTEGDVVASHKKLLKDFRSAGNVDESYEERKERLDALVATGGIKGSYMEMLQAYVDTALAGKNQQKKSEDDNTAIDAMESLGAFEASESHEERLETFVAAVNTNDGSKHIIHVDKETSLHDLFSSFMSAAPGSSAGSSRAAGGS